MRSTRALAAGTCTRQRIGYHTEAMYKTYHINSNKPIDPQMHKIMADFGTVGVSSGYAAAYLGITRQSLEYAISNGSLRACKIYENRKHISTLVDTASLDAYKELRTLNGGRIPYGARALA